MSNEKMTDKAWQCDLLASCLDDWGHPTEAANVRSGEDLESYESDFRLLQKLIDYGLLDATPAPVAGDAVAYEHIIRSDKRWLSCITRNQKWPWKRELEGFDGRVSWDCRPLFYAGVIANSLASEEVPRVD